MLQIGSGGDSMTGSWGHICLTIVAFGLVAGDGAGAWAQAGAQGGARECRDVSSSVIVNGNPRVETRKFCRGPDGRFVAEQNSPVRPQSARPATMQPSVKAEAAYRSGQQLRVLGADAGEEAEYAEEDGDMEDAKELSALERSYFGRALKDYQIACDGQHALACNEAGTMIMFNWTIAADPVSATRYFRLACEGGAKAGCSNLAFAYVHGRGVAQSNARAIEYYRRALAIDPGYIYAKNQIATLEKR